jgi:glutamyl-Q tRNA(Asp) synthetase
VRSPPGFWQGDVILARKETPTAITWPWSSTTRRRSHDVVPPDLFTRPRCRLLQALLRLPQPRYCHHRLISCRRQKLSKSTLSTGLRELRARGASPAEIRRLVGLD